MSHIRHLDLPSDMVPLMTIRQLSQYLNVHEVTLYNLVQKGRVPAMKIGGQWRFRRDLIDEWVEMQMQVVTLPAETVEATSFSGVPQA